MIEALFGVSVAADGTVRAAGCVAALDPQAVLGGLRVGERHYDIHASGGITETAG